MKQKTTQYSAIGRRIKLAREKNHITQEELATAINCSPQHISVIERGIKLPRLDTFIKIINTLNVSPEIVLQDLVSSPIDNAFDKEFSSLVSPLPTEEKQRILEVVRLLVDTYNC